MEYIKVRITKLEELPDALHPNNIPVNWSKEFIISEEDFKLPELEKRYNLGTFSSSMVTEIIDDNTFKTLSSIYKFEILKLDNYDKRRI